MSMWDDARVRRGLERQLERRRALAAEGVAAIGWKAGFGTAVAMEAIGTTGPLVAFMTERTVVPDGGEVDVGGWTSPTVEPEVAVRMGADLPAGGGEAAATAAIGALAPAIELVDLDGPRDGDAVEEVLASGIFHRHVVLGAFTDAGAVEPETIRVTVDAGARRLVSGADPGALIGSVAGVVAAVADLLADAGEPLRAGDVVITGAAVAPFAAQPGERVTCRFDGLGEVAVAFAPGA